MKVVITKDRNNKEIPTLFMDQKGNMVSIKDKKDFQENDLYHTIHTAETMLMSDFDTEEHIFSVDMTAGEYQNFYDLHQTDVYNKSITASSIELRLANECKALCDKANKLHEFKKSVEFYKLDRESKDLLYEQSRLMDKYIQVLGKRMEKLGINNFKVDKGGA